MTEKKEEQHKIYDWLDKEIENIELSGIQMGDRLPSLKMESGKVYVFMVDFSQPFPKWTGGNPQVTKAIIPVIHKGERKNLWLNVKNPLYREICKRGKDGQREFMVSVTGAQKDTRYNLVEKED